MGGSGSGMGIRFNTRRTKAFVQERKSINARMFDFRVMQQVPKKGVSIVLHGVDTLVTPNYMEIYHHIGDTDKTLRISLAQSKANYGNTRYWMHCPHPKCQRRCGKLYLCKLPDGMPVFLCRKCLHLVYRSQNRTFLDRMIDKKWDIIRKKLKSDSGISWEKPKGMHWKTFHSLTDQVETLDSEIMLGIANKCI